MDLVMEFWIHARHMIYPNEKFADHDLKAIKNLIWRNIFKGFPPEISEKEFRAYLHICKERLTMAQKWIKNHPNFITLPPHLYFGPEKKAGTFHQTWDWYVNSQRKKEWNKIFAEVEKFRAGKLQFTQKGNKYTPTVQELYKSHLDRLKRFGDQELIDRLNACTSENLNFYLGYKSIKLKQNPTSGNNFQHLKPSIL